MDFKSTTFTSHRPRLFGIAYRMLGRKSDAEDVLQDAYLRWHAVADTQVRSTEAWLTTAVTRLCIDKLRKAKVEREAYFGPWLPEPLSARDVSSPELALELDEDISIAFLTLLETLSPEERAVFVLHDILDDDYAEIAQTVGKSEAGCRQIVHRARERMTARRRRFHIDEATRVSMLKKFIEAAQRGDRAALVSLFASDAIMASDGGGKATAVHRPLYGADRIAWLWYAVARRAGAPERRILRANGEPAVGTYWNGRLHSVATIETDGEYIHAYYSIANPDKLGSFL